MMDAFVFIPQASDGVIQSLEEIKQAQAGEENRIRAYAVMSGPYEVVVFVEVQSLGDLRPLVVGAIREQAGAGETRTAVALPPPELQGVLAPRPPKRPGIAEREAFTRIRVQAGRGVAVFTELANMGVEGAALVAGDFDIFAEIQGPTVDAVLERLLQVNAIKGIRWTDSGVATHVSADEATDSI